MAIKFEWDDAKAASNEAKHAVPFEYATRIFLDGERVDWDVSRNIDGEERRKVVGLIEGLVFSVVYTLRDDVYRIISARRANKQETNKYG